LVGVMSIAIAIGAAILAWLLALRTRYVTPSV